MKTKILFPILAILLIAFVVGFISKEEIKSIQNLDKEHFKKYLAEFSVATFPLKIKANHSLFNDRNRIHRKYAIFLPNSIRRRMSRNGDISRTYEYICKVAETQEIVAVICGSYLNVGKNVNDGNYNKTLFIYSKKGEILTEKELAYEDDEVALTANINADLTFYTKKFYLENEKWTLDKTEEFLITTSGEIVAINSKESIKTGKNGN